MVIFLFYSSSHPYPSRARSISVGGDRLEIVGQGYIALNAFTDGSIVPRMRWFQGGFDSGHMDACDTFSL